MAILKDLTGQKFNRWTVLGRTQNPPNKKNRYWDCICECSCGHKQDYLGSNLRQGIISKCSKCAKKDHFPTEDKAWIAEFNAYISGNYRSRKKLYNSTTFDLTISDFKQITSSDCYYCGASPNKKLRTGVELYRNSIDRLINTEGYTLSNCVPCCRVCNMMKKDLSKEIFLEHIKNLYNHLIKENPCLKEN